MKKIYLAGNWKMNKTSEETARFINSLHLHLHSNRHGQLELIIAPPLVFVRQAVNLTRESIIKVSAQNVSQFSQGAYTGEVAAGMLQSAGADYCIIGHSERRRLFGESDEIVKEKLLRLTEYTLPAIVCVGETLSEREADKTFEVLERQITKVFSAYSLNEKCLPLLAYEPVWAIGTGNTATAAQAQEVHKFIRELLAKLYNEEFAQATPILYGGSVNPENIKELVSQPDIDGGLIGGASLNIDSFLQMISICAEITK